jgi:hypothetical protein
MRRLWLAIIALAVVVTSCSPSGRDPGARDSVNVCPPAWPKLSRTTVPLGGRVIVSSSGFPCGSRFAHKGEYELLLTKGDSRPPVLLAKAAAARNGSFHAMVRIPANFPSGQAGIAVQSPALRRFLVCPPNDACAAYSVGIYLTPST